MNCTDSLPIHLFWMHQHHSCVAYVLVWIFCSKSCICRYFQRKFGWINDGCLIRKTIITQTNREKTRKKTLRFNRFWLSLQPLSSLDSSCSHYCKKWFSFFVLFRIYSHDEDKYLFISYLIKTFIVTVKSTPSS